MYVLMTPYELIFFTFSLRGLCFEGVMFGWAYIRKEICVKKSAQTYTWRESCVSKSIGLAYSWKEIYDSIFYRRKHNR